MNPRPHIAPGIPRTDARRPAKRAHRLRGIRRALRGVGCRLAALLLALAHLCTIPALLPAAFAALAKMEGSHGVTLSVRGGDTRVVLTHGAKCRTPHSAIHCHGMFARVLTSITGRDANGPDHVAHFLSGQSTGLEKRVAPLELTEPIEIAAPVAALEIGIADFAPVPAPRWPEGAPPRPPAQLAALRGTLLLI